ncbi:MAG: hypothetical protein ACHQ50_06585 [Fimbriimonadales bacterium]
MPFAIIVAASLMPPYTPSGAIVIHSNSFAYTTTPDGYAAQSWENLAAKTRLNLGQTAEVELETGESPQAPTKVKLRPAEQPPEVASDGSKAVLHLRSTDGTLAVAITFEADPKWPIMHKFVQVTNSGSQTTRLLNIVLGRYPVGDTKTEGGDRGFPLYLNRQFFLSLTHPAGFAHVEGREVVLRQYPGVKLAPGQTFRSMEAVYGVAKTGEARTLFVDYVRSRMARVLYGHAKPYAILEAFGGQPDGDFKENYSIGISDAYLHKHLAQVADSRHDSGTQFDFYSIEFWHDRAGDLTQFNRENFPNGFDKARQEILDLGMKPGLWIDSGGLPDWSVDQNPATRPSRTGSDGQGSFCRASEPIASIYKNGFLYQMRENKVGLLKFDNLNAVCNNPAHDHLPGPFYSTEAIYNSVIEFFQTLRQANPDVFMMLYWHYRSPWWLLYGDTYFESGEDIEAASPSQYPAPYARDSVTQRLDQAQLKVTDTPWLGKDSLGVWLSDWTWNSGIGKARWQEGVVMDIARGSLLLQLWTDADWLTPPERAQVATFIDLMKANTSCFDHSKPILGDPNRAEPYGYSCCDGKKAFLAIDNACLKDSVVKLNLGPTLGLPAGRRWDVYRWYPRPARLLGSAGVSPAIRSSEVTDLSIAMRPYEVVLLEVVPAGEKPSLNRRFADSEANTSFLEKTRILPLDVRVEPVQADRTSWTTLRPGSAVSARGARLTIKSDGSVLAGGTNSSNDTYRVSAPAGLDRVTGLLLETLTDSTLPANGPGRAVNGNFALTGLRVKIATRDHPDQKQDVRMSSATADFSQTSFGGWPVTAAIDGDPRTGWSIHPLVGMAHAAVFRFDRPIGFPSGSTLEITLEQGQNGHSLGRFRLSVTADSVPLLPVGYRPATASLSCNVPATKEGGLILLVGSDREDAPRGSMQGLPLTLTSVWATRSNWGCPWTAWRAEIAPSSQPRQIEIKVDRRQAQVGSTYTAYFLPGMP